MTFPRQIKAKQVQQTNKQIDWNLKVKEVHQAKVKWYQIKTLKKSPCPRRCSKVGKTPWPASVRTEVQIQGSYKNRSRSKSVCNPSTPTEHVYAHTRRGIWHIHCTNTQAKNKKEKINNLKNHIFTNIELTLWAGGHPWNEILEWG